MSRPIAVPLTVANGTAPDFPVIIPPLEAGDTLTRAEFERRYQAMPSVKKAELIEGVVHMPSPVRLQKHSVPHATLVGLLWHYSAYTPGLIVGDNSTVRLDLDNEPQPDAVLMIEPARGGKVRISSDDYIEGAPELVAEVASSSASIDLNTKLRVYRRNEVQEYVVWRVLDKEIDWFALQEGESRPLPKDAAGVYRSRVFPGLWLDAPALLRNDLAAVLQMLQHGLESAAHAEFVKRLQTLAPPDAKSAAANGG